MVGGDGTRDFVLFFDEKEGTSPVVRLLDNVAGVSIVHQEDDTGWEPFDRHMCGAMPLGSLRTCLEAILGSSSVDMGALNEVYTATARRPLAPVARPGVVGFKMRFEPPDDALPRQLARVPWVGERIAALVWRRRRRAFRSMVFDVLERTGTVTFIAVRQDVFRWALSKYHGDGSGRPGHLQFKLAYQELAREDIPSFHADPDQLAAVIRDCEGILAAKRALVDDLTARGIAAHALLYEDFVSDPRSFLRDLLARLGRAVTEAELDDAFERGSVFEKVHDADVSTFVTNHREVVERFGDRFVSWR